MLLMLYDLQPTQKIKNKKIVVAFLWQRYKTYLYLNLLQV